MGLFDSLDISGSGLSAERMRMDVTAENLANAQTTRGANGQPYRRKEVVLQEAGGSAQGGFGAALAGALGAKPGQTPGGVEVAGVVEDSTPTSSSTTRVTPTPTRRATCACPTSSP